MEMKREEDFTRVPRIVRSAVDAGDVCISPCLYLVRDQQGVDGEYGGWPHLPPEVEWPRVDGEALAFLCWVDLAKMSALHSVFQMSGRLLVFQHSSAEPRSLIHLSEEQVKKSTTRKLLEGDIYYRADDETSPADGHAYVKESFSIVEGLSAHHLNDVSNSVDKALDRLIPLDVIGQIGGFLGVEHDSIVEYATFRANGSDKLLEYRDFWDASLDQLPEGEDMPEEWELGKLMDIDLSAIVTRLKSARVFFEQSLEEVKKIVKSQGYKWTTKYANVVKKLNLLEGKYSSEALTDPFSCNHWVGAVKDLHIDLHVKAPYLINALESLGYTGEKGIVLEKEIHQVKLKGHVDSEELDLLNGPKGESLELAARVEAAETGNLQALERMCIQMRLLEDRKVNEIVNNPSASGYEKALALLQKMEMAKNREDAFLISTMQSVLELVNKYQDEMQLYELTLLTFDLWRVPHNISCSKNHEHRNQLSKADALKLREAVKWKLEYSDDQLNQMHKEWLPWLVIYEASNWCWGDCGQRIYLSTRTAVERGDLSKFHIYHDQS